MTKMDKNTIDKTNEKEIGPELDKIAEWIKDVKFKKQLIGGLNQLDVWNKLEELNTMYEEALRAERVRYDTLISHYKESQKTEDAD